MQNFESLLFLQEHQGDEFYNSELLFVFSKLFLFCSWTSSLLKPSDSAPLSSSSLNVTQWPGSFKCSGPCAAETADGAWLGRWQEESVSRSKRLVLFARELLSESSGGWPATVINSVTCSQWWYCSFCLSWVLVPASSVWRAVILKSLISF